MSDLSTADLAGGTTPHARETAMPTETRDPKVQPQTRDTQFRRDDDTFDARDDSMRDSAMTTPPATAARTSTLPNPAATDGATRSDNATPLFPTGEAETFRSRWMEAQTSFVDEPRSAVEQADNLVAEMMKRLAQVFADERGKLEEQWSRGDDISTEDLRVALQRYRSFFDRLLQV
jgi:hypothetical protein